MRLENNLFSENFSKKIVFVKNVIKLIFEYVKTFPKKSLFVV